MTHVPRRVPVTTLRGGDEFRCHVQSGGTLVATVSRVEVRPRGGYSVTTTSGRVLTFSSGAYVAIVRLAS